MCGRVHITKTIDQLAQDHNLHVTRDQKELLPKFPHFNISPGMYLPLVLQGNQKELFALHWGLIPFWAKSKQIGYKMINARIETVLSKSAFAKPVKTQRAVLFINGFYEWKKRNGGKQPYRIFPEEEDYFVLACIHDRWVSKDHHEIHSFSILTQAAQTPISNLHDRMPVFLSSDMYRLWLDSSSDAESLIEELAQKPLSNSVQFHPVSKKVNKASNNQKFLLEKKDLDLGSGEQLSLF